MDQFSLLQLVALIMVLFLVVPGYLHWRKRAPKGSGAKYIIIWLVLAIFIALLYQFFEN